MRKLRLALICLILTGCGNPLTVEQVAEARAYCESKGMRIEINKNLYSEVNSVYCVDNNNARYKAK